jgi:hypothetical protein
MGDDVPSYDFEVDLQSLVEAAKGTADTIQLFKDKDAEDLVPTEDELGNDVVWSACDEFQERWDDGMNNLTKDAEEAAGRLGKIASNYASFDADAAEKMSGVTGEITGFQLMGK